MLELLSPHRVSEVYFSQNGRGVQIVTVQFCTPVVFLTRISEDPPGFYELENTTVEMCPGDMVQGLYTVFMFCLPERVKQK